MVANQAKRKHLLLSRTVSNKGEEPRPPVFLPLTVNRTVIALSNQIVTENVQ